jgi:hypothetical protein
MVARMTRFAKAVLRLLGFFALWLPGPAWAQQPSAGSEAAVGKSVHVVFVEGTRTTIKFLGIQDRQVLGRSGAQQVQYPIERVTRVERVTHVTLYMTLAGLGIGAGAGIPSSRNSEASGVEIPVAAGIGAGAGWLIGRLISHSTAPGRTVYAAPSRSISMLPLVSHTAIGGAVHVRWR